MKPLDDTGLSHLWGLIKNLVTSVTTLKITITSFSSLPQTVTNADIKNDMVVVNSILSNPSVQTADWKVTTANGSLTISGTNAIKGSTTLTLYLSKSR